MTKFIGYKNWLNESEESSGSQIIDYLNQVAKMMAGNGRQGKYWQWKADHAKLLKQVKTDAIGNQYPGIARYVKTHKKQVIQKQCYKNAAQLCTSCPGVKYVEGEISYHGIPIEHAWNKIDDKYFDITKDVLFNGSTDYAEYVSIIELSDTELYEFMIETGTYGGFLREKFLKDTK